MSATPPRAQMPVVTHGAHAFRWLADGDTAYEAMLAGIALARREVVLETYIFRPGLVAARFRRALAEAARRGVRVRVLLDAFGSDESRRGNWSALRRAGAELRWFNPVQLLRASFRNHRKLVIADGVAIVGGLNIADEYAGDGVVRGWRDLALEVRGPLAAALMASFERMWALAAFHAREVRAFARRSGVSTRVDPAEPQLLLSGPGCRSAELRASLHADLARARGVDAYAAYFLPSRRLRRLLARAARAGSVRILVPARGDVPLAQFANFHAMRRLARTRVRFFAYAPQMLHAKLVLVDDTVYIGSANLDVRSRQINYELMLRLPVPALAAQARDLFEHDLVYARPIEAARPTRIARCRDAIAYFLLSRVDPYLAQRKLRALQ